MAVHQHKPSGTAIANLSAGSNWLLAAILQASGAFDQAVSALNGHISRVLEAVHFSWNRVLTATALGVLAFAVAYLVFYQFFWSYAYILKMEMFRQDPGYWEWRHRLSHLETATPIVLMGIVLLLLCRRPQSLLRGRGVDEQALPTIAGPLNLQAYQIMMCGWTFVLHYFEYQGWAYISAFASLIAGGALLGKENRVYTIIGVVLSICYILYYNLFSINLASLSQMSLDHQYYPFFELLKSFFISTFIFTAFPNLLGLRLGAIELGRFRGNISLPEDRGVVPLGSAAAVAMFVEGTVQLYQNVAFIQAIFSRPDLEVASRLSFWAG